MRRVAAIVALVVVTLGASTTAVSAQSGDFPAFDAPLVDAAGAVSDDAEAQLNEELQGFQSRTGHQVGVAVVETTGERSLEDYANDLFASWGLGSAAEDDGVLLLIALGGDRGVRIEVGGGLEGDLTDVESADIVDELLDPLRAGDVTGALQRGVPLLRGALGDPGGAAPTNGRSEDPAPSPLSAVVPLLFIALLLVSLVGGRRRRNRRGRSLGPFIFWGGGFGGGGLGGFGGRGFGGGGGGFGGGGGGDSFGGGASGRW